MEQLDTEIFKMANEIFTTLQECSLLLLLDVVFNRYLLTLEIFAFAIHIVRIEFVQCLRYYFPMLLLHIPIKYCL